MIFRAGLTSLFCIITLLSFAQLFYANSEASFQVSENMGQYRVECTLKKDVAGSRHLKRVQNRLRLRAVDLVGNYIIFNRLDVDYPNKDQLFGAFVEYNNLMFRAQVEKFSAGQWDFYGRVRCITFTCNNSDFTIEEHQYQENFDITKIMMLDFRRNKTIEGACNIVSAGLHAPDETLDLEMVFLSGKASLGKITDRLLKFNPGGRLENSLFGADSVMQNLVVSATETIEGGCPFSEMVKLKILFTSAPSSLKDSIYQIYLDHLSMCENTWYRIHLFSAGNRDTSAFLGIGEATVFDVIGAYPMALDVFGLRVGYGGTYYEAALEAFAHEDIEKALDLLKDEINFAGITPEALNLTGACYRVLKRPAKALPYLLLAFYLNRETAYLAGNICLCLDGMQYNDLGRITTYFLASSKTDRWSKTQIHNLINQ